MRVGGAGGGRCHRCLPFDPQMVYSERRSMLQTSATKSQTQSRRPRSSFRVRGPWACPTGPRKVSGEGNHEPREGSPVPSNMAMLNRGASLLCFS